MGVCISGCDVGSRNSCRFFGNIVFTSVYGGSTGNKLIYPGWRVVEAKHLQQGMSMYGMAIGYGIAAAGQEDKVGFKTISFVRMHRRLDLRFKLLVK